MTEINVNNISLNYELEGSGKTIVFVHGLSDNLEYWKILTNELKNKYQVLSFDLRGHGNSSINEDDEVSIDLYQDDLFKLLKRLEIDNAVFVGLSLGGNIIMDFAIKHPEMVNGLIIMSSFSNQSEKLVEIFNDFEKGIDKGFVEFFDIIVPYTLTGDMLEKHRETLDIVKYEAAEHANIEGIKKGIKAGYEFNVTERLSEIDAPTIVMAGAEDDLTDLDIQMEISNNIKDSELIILDNTKHNLLVGYNIEKILNIIDDFMSKIE